MEQQDKKNIEIGSMSVADFLRVLWSEKITVLAVTLAVFLTALAASIFLVKNVYTSRAKILVSQQEETQTAFGIYPAPMKSLTDYIALAENQKVYDSAAKALKLEPATVKSASKLEYDPKSDSSQFEITATHEDPKEAQRINQALSKAYLEQVRHFVRELALGYFEQNLPMTVEATKVNIDQLTREIEAGRKLLATMTPTYKLKELFIKDPEKAQEIANSAGLSRQEVESAEGDKEYVNSNFFSMEAEIMRLEAEKINQEELIKSLEAGQANLKKARADLTAAGDNKGEDLLNDSLDVAKNQVHISSAASLPQSTDRNMKKLVPLFGLILGLGLGIIAGYLRAFWKATK